MEFLAAAVLFIIVVYGTPALLVFLVFITLYYKVSRRAAFSWIGLLIVGVTAFFSYFRLGFDQRIADRAIAQKDPNVCHRLLRAPRAFSGFGGEKIAPREECYGAYLQAFPSPTTCNEIPDWVRCYQEWQLIQGEFGDCQRWRNAAERVQCAYGLAFQKDLRLPSTLLSDCEKLTTEIDRENCIMSVAVANNDPSLCRSFKEFFPLRQCVQRLGLHFSLAGMAASVCLHLDEATLADCYYWFAITSKEPALCESIPADGHSQIRGWCLKGLAVW